MAYSLRIHDYAGTQLAVVAPKKGSSRWTHKHGEDGSGRFQQLGTLAAAALAEGTIVRVHNGTSDVFAFVPQDKARRALDSPGQTEVDLSGPGVRSLLHAGQIYQEDTSDCAAPADERWFGWMSGAYDSGGWARAKTFGTFLAGFWVTPRPENWPVSLAEYITISTDPIAEQTDWGAIRKVTVDVETDYLACIAADDEYRLWIDGTEIGSTIGGGAFQWQRWQQYPVRLCPGEHTIAIQVRNLRRPVTTTNYTWLIFGLAPAGADGKPLSANSQYAVYHDHTGGTFTLASTYGTSTVPIDWNEDAATLQFRLEQLATIGPGNVSVTGTGNVENQVYLLSHDHTSGTFTLEAAFGATTAPLAHNASAATIQAALEGLITIGAGNVVVSGAGTSADPWRIEFVGAFASEPYTLEANSALTGGTTFSLSNDQTGLADPWIITFQGDLVSKHIPLTADGSGLTGGTGIEVDEYVRGRGASADVRTDTNWVVRDFTDGVSGLTATHILQIADDEVRARGETVFDHITEDFTATTDTAGAVLPEIVLPVSLPADVHRLTVLLEQAGYQIELAPDLALQCWAARGADLSGTVDLTAWSAGVSGLEATRADGATTNVLRVRTDEGWHEVTDAASVAARGRWEDGTTLEFASEAEADLVTGPIAERHATPPRITTFELTSHGPVVPYEHLDMCDLVLSSAFAAAGYDDIPMRWIGVTARIEDAEVRYQMELVD